MLHNHDADITNVLQSVYTSIKQQTTIYCFVKKPSVNNKKNPEQDAPGSTQPFPIEPHGSFPLSAAALFRTVVLPCTTNLNHQSLLSKYHRVHPKVYLPDYPLPCLYSSFYGRQG